MYNMTVSRPIRRRDCEVLSFVLSVPFTDRNRIHRWMTVRAMSSNPRRCVPGYIPRPTDDRHNYDGRIRLDWSPLIDRLQRTAITILTKLYCIRTTTDHTCRSITVFPTPARRVLNESLRTRNSAWRSTNSIALT